MSANGHTTVWGTHLGIGRSTDARGWRQQLKAWWAEHQAARRVAHLARLNARSGPFAACGRRGGHGRSGACHLDQHGPLRPRLIERQADALFQAIRSRVMVVNPQ